MSDDDKLIAEVYRKIEREKALIHAASNMRQSTDNPTVQARVDSNIRDGRRNIAYLEEKMRDLQVRRLGRDEGDGGPPPPTHGALSAAQQQGLNQRNGPTPPPKDARGKYFANERGDYGDAGPGGYSAGNSGMMPPRAPYGDPRPFAPVPKARPNYSKLGMLQSATNMRRANENLRRSYQI